MAQAFNRLKTGQIRERFNDADPTELSALMSEFWQGGLLKFLKVRKEDGTVHYICGRLRKDRNKLCCRTFLCPMEVFSHTDEVCLSTEVKLCAERSNLRRITTFYAAPVFEANGKPLCGIVRGEKSQADGYEGSPCTAMALSFFKFAMTEQVCNNFTTRTLTDILDFGSKMYWDCRRRLGGQQDMLTVFEMRGEYLCRNGSSFRVEVCEKPELEWDGRMEEPNMFQNSVKHFLESAETYYAVITTSSQSMGVVKQGDFLFMFDSHARGEKGDGGARCETPLRSRKSCLLIFDKTNASQCSYNVAHHFQSNLEFTAGDYSISPVSVSITPNAY